MPQMSLYEKEKFLSLSYLMKHHFNEFKIIFIFQLENNQMTREKDQRALSRGKCIHAIFICDFSQGPSIPTWEPVSNCEWKQQALLSESAVGSEKNLWSSFISWKKKLISKRPNKILFLPDLFTSALVGRTREAIHTEFYYIYFFLIFHLFSFTCTQ